MNKREQARILRKNRKIMAEASYAMLTGSAEGYRLEALRLRDAGLSNAGHFGTSCPTCWREICMNPRFKRPPKGFCQCDSEESISPRQVKEALGFAEAEFHFSARQIV